MALPTRTTVKELDPVFAEMAAASFQRNGEGPELTPREQILLSLVADVCGQVLGMPYELHVRAALDNGLDADDLRELLRFISYDSGYPAALAALERLAEIEREHGLPGPTGQGHQLNADGTGSPMPAAMRAQVHALDPGFADYMDRRSDTRRGPRRRPRDRDVRDDPDLARPARPRRTAGRAGGTGGTADGQGRLTAPRLRPTHDSDNRAGSARLWPRAWKGEGQSRGIVRNGRASTAGERGRGQGRVRMRGPSWVTAMVCSMWAARLPSIVRRVHPSASVR